MLGRNMLLIAMLLSAAGSGLAEPPRHVTWGELSFVTGRTVRISMPDGAVISGKTTAVEPDALVMRIERTANKTAYPKGSFRVPRSGLKVLEMQRRSYHWRVISTALGACAGLAGGFAAAVGIDGLWGSNGRGGQAAAALIGITVGLTTAGYLVGNAADKHFTTITIRE